MKLLGGGADLWKGGRYSFYTATGPVRPFDCILALLAFVAIFSAPLLIFFQPS